MSKLLAEVRRKMEARGKSNCVEAQNKHESAFDRMDRSLDLDFAQGLRPEH